MMKKLLVLLFVMILGASLSVAQYSPTNNVLFVKKGSEGNGSSWATAIGELADALKWAKENESNWTSENPLQIWVASGIYVPLYSPIDGSNFANEGKNNAFLLIGNVHLYGGFNGTESSISEIDFNSNSTILSGDLNGDDNLSGFSDNVYHVLIGSGIVNSKVKGFTIRDANSNESTAATTTINGNQFLFSSGGGFYVVNSTVELTYNKFINNKINYRGAGIYSQNSNLNIVNSLIADNTGGNNGKGILASGGTIKITNSTIVNNKNISGDSSNTITLYASNTFIGNNLIICGTRVNYGGSFTFNYSFLEGNTNTASGNLNASGIMQEHLFLNSGNQDYSLLENAPVKDLGDNILYEDSDNNSGNNSLNTDKDLAGLLRLYGDKIDMGAYEFQPIVISPNLNNILFVNKTATGNGSGSSWSNAIPELADALKWAKENESNWTPGNPLQIWVAAGTYKPMYSPRDGGGFADEGRLNTFLMVNNVQVYGGFAGTETSLAERNLSITTNQSVLSGDIGVSDNNSDNAYHVLISAGETGESQLDGFTVTKGFSDSSENINVNGLVISANYGSGMYNTSSSPIISNVIFTGNSSAIYGGGMFNNNSSPTILNSKFIENNAIFGGGLYNDSSSPKITNSIFSGNAASSKGGGMLNFDSSSPVITNVSFGENTATNESGAIFNQQSSLPIIVNTILWGNIAPSNPEMGSADEFPYIYFSLIKGFDNSNNGGFDGTDSSNDPLFIDSSLNLPINSPAINYGSNSYYNDPDQDETPDNNYNNDKDVAGNPRVFDGSSTTDIIDLGAYEFQADTCPVPTNLNYSQINSTSATLSWTSEGTKFNLIWGDEGFDLENEGTLVSNISTTNYELTDLTSGHQYQFYVQNVCESIGTTSEFVGPFDFSVSVPPAEIPWNENFTSTQIPSGWSINDWIINSIDPRIPNNDGNVIYKNLYDAENQRNGVFETIRVGSVNSGDILSFKYQLSNYYSPETPPAAGSGNFSVEVSNDNGANYTTIFTYNNDAMPGWQEFEYSLIEYIGETIKIKITANWISGDYDLAFDQFYIGAPITCETPGNVTVSNIGSRGATFSWNEVDNALNYYWSIYESGDDPNTVSCVVCGIHFQTTLALDNNLELETNYDFYVQTNCGETDGLSQLSEKLEFTTLSEIEYCIIPEPGINDTTGITNVTFNTINNATDNNEGYYNDYTSISTEIQAGESYDLNVNVDTAGEYWVYTKAWIDWNKDGEFNTDNEQYDLGNAFDVTNGLTSQSPLEIEIPIDAQGQYRMRIRTVYNNNLFTACSNEDYSEAEDYTMNVNGAVTWTGSEWINGFPAPDVSVLISGPLTIGTDVSSFEVNSLMVTGGGSIDIESGNSLTINGYVHNKNEAIDFVVANDANLIQVNNDENIGAITVQRNSQPMIRLDYTLWSSPVLNQNLFNFSPETVNGVTNYIGSLGRIYIYGANGYVNPNPFDENSVMNSGTGYLFRSPNNFDASVPAVYEGVFTGIPFNGDLSVTTVANNYTSLGNPYPSNLDADLLFAANSETLQTLYFWVNTPIVDGQYVGNNYATYNLSGGVSNIGTISGAGVPSGIIATGQGFIAFTSGTSLNFSNTMRTGDASDFLKTTDTERHRFWLNLSDENNIGLNQILIAYIEGATLGLDKQIDGELFGYEGSAIYSLIEDASTGSATKFTIQGRSLPFEDSDVVPIGFRAIESGKFKIELTNFDGLFAEEQKIFIKDKDLDLIQDLEIPYEFESPSGIFNNRFEIVYKDGETMGTDDLVSNGVQIYKKQKFIEISSKLSQIESVEIYDLSGRKLFHESEINTSTFQIDSQQFGVQVLVVKVKTENGVLTNKKIVNN